MTAQFETGVYSITNMVNGKRYIGSAVRFEKRWGEHRRQLCDGKHHSIALQRAWSKYGAGIFKFEKKLICAPENLILYEQAFFDAYNPEYNIARKAGSQLGFKMGPEARAKLSAAAKRTKNRTGIPHTAESKARISASKTGVKLGPQSAERRAKIGAAHKGRVITSEMRAKISATLTGHKQSAEQIEKRMQKIRGRKMPEGFAEAARARMLGYIPSAETLAKIGRARASLSDDQVVAIRQLLTRGVKQRVLAVIFKIDASTISSIKSRTRYAWVV